MINGLKVYMPIVFEELLFITYIVPTISPSYIDATDFHWYQFNSEAMCR